MIVSMCGSIIMWHYDTLILKVLSLPSIHSKSFLVNMIATWWNNTRGSTAWRINFSCLLYCWCCLQSNPVLEAFGNAKTFKSSHFGKFMEISFAKNWRMSGAATRTYRLERSRVCQVSDPECNYHCFSLLCAAPKEFFNLRRRFKSIERVSLN